MKSTSRPWWSVEPAPEGANAEGLGGVVARRDIVDAVLGGLVEDPLGGLARDVGIEPGRNRLVELSSVRRR